MSHKGKKQHKRGNNGRPCCSTFCHYGTFCYQGDKICSNAFMFCHQYLFLLALYPFLFTCISVHVIFCVWVHVSQQCVCVLRGVGERGQQGVCACVYMGVLQQSFRWVLETEIMSTQHFQTLSLDDVHLKDFMYFIVTRQPGNNYRKMPLVMYMTSVNCC